MQENIYERITKTLSWKRIIAFNVVLFLVLIVPISVRLAGQDTENRSGAAGEVEIPVVTPPPAYPTQGPVIERVSTFFGKTGDTVVILGNNFGDYQWGSSVFVGNTEAPSDNIVRWSNTILEVKIPEAARTGQVWIIVNGRESFWEGSLLLYDVAKSAQAGLDKINNTQGSIYITNATGGVRGMIELSHVSEPLTLLAGTQTTITGQSNTVDSLGKKIRVNFELNPSLSSTRYEIARYEYPGLGSIEIIRAELYDASGRLIPIYVDPLNIKVTP